MWAFQEAASSNQDPQRFFLTSMRDYTLGRKDCDIILSSPSVSRKHATIALDRTSGDQLLVEDHSKVGCFVNGERIASGSRTALKNGDEILFGAQDKFTIQFRPLIICCSGMRSSDKATAVANATKIGGKATESLEECTHLVMNEFALTAKGLMALIYGKSIVTPQWLSELLTRSSPHSPLPLLEAFQPPIKDPLLQGASLLAADDRRNFFEFSVFVFFSKPQYEKASAVITAAKAEALLFEDLSKKELVQLSKTKDLFLVQPHSPSADMESKLRAAEEYGVIVPENEIGLAIVLQNRDRMPKTKRTLLSKKPITASSASLPPSQRPTKSPSLDPTPALAPAAPLATTHQKQQKKRTAEEALEGQKDLPKEKLSSPPKQLHTNSSKKPPIMTTSNQTSPKKEAKRLSTDTSPSSPKKTQLQKAPPLSSNQTSPKKQTPITPATISSSSVSSPKKQKLHSAPPAARPVSIASKRASLDSAPVVRPITPVSGKVNFKRFRKSEDGKIVSPVVKPILCIDPTPSTSSTTPARTEDTEKKTPEVEKESSFLLKAQESLLEEEKDRQQMQDLFQSNAISVTVRPRPKNTIS